MEKIKQILKDSTLSATLSSAEIEDLVEEISDELESYIEEKEEAIEQSLDIDGLNDEIDQLKNLIDQQREELRSLHTFRGNSINDKITTEWVKSNWEHLIQLQQMNLNGADLVNKFCKC
jgi:hypothetical protein